jgi:hypothetical protein
VSDPDVPVRTHTPAELRAVARVTARARIDEAIAALMASAELAADERAGPELSAMDDTVYLLRRARERIGQAHARRRKETP